MQLEEEVLDTSEPLFGSVQTQNIIVFILVLYANRVDCIHCLNKPGNWTMWTLPNLGSEVSKYVDTSELRFRSVQNLVLELETRPLTEPFRIHVFGFYFI